MGADDMGMIRVCDDEPGLCTGLDLERYQTRGEVARKTTSSPRLRQSPSSSSSDSSLMPWRHSDANGLAHMYPSAATASAASPL